MNNCTANNLYIISFTVGADSGIALVSARTDRESVQILRNGGKFNALPESYKPIQVRNLGLSASIRTELLMESYVNAMQAYNAILSSIGKYLKGEPGDSVLANMYVDEDLYLHIVENNYVITPRLSFDESTRYITII